MSKHLFLSRATKHSLGEILDGILWIYDNEGEFDSVIVLDRFTGEKVLGMSSFGNVKTSYRVKNEKVRGYVRKLEELFGTTILYNLPTLWEQLTHIDWRSGTIESESYNLKRALRGLYVGYLPLFLRGGNLADEVVFVDNNENVRGRIRELFSTLNLEVIYEQNLKKDIKIFDESAREYGDFIFLPGKLMRGLSSGKYIYDGKSLRPHNVGELLKLVIDNAPGDVYDIINPEDMFYMDLERKVVVSCDLLDEQLIDFLSVRGASAYISSRLNLRPGQAKTIRGMKVINPSNIDEGIVSVLYVSGGRVDYKPYRIF